MKATNKPQEWSALYMQNPIPDEGNIFKKTHFLRWNELERGLPKFSYVIISADTAFSTKTTADHSTYGVWGIFADEEHEIKGVMLLEASKGHWDYPTLKKNLIEVYQKYKAKYLIIEKKASGQSIIQDLAQMGLPVIGWPLSGAKMDDKTTRAHACVPFLEAGMVWILDGHPWVEDFLTELYNFSESAEKDDQVDQFTQAILWMRDNLQLKLKDYGTIKRNYDDDDDDKPKVKKRPSYWRARIRR
jgi:predicted phage terminase large subunit-like protein